ncbi:restriction endonuclease subunit S [Streptococcus pseudopneumoniae]|uniref:restriction endonuclease subunit S n=1 Tax=Streptococcus TaxID=1301 RepID=UPI00021AFF09|nr:MULTISPECIES: restriction endonuclease subunit S [Streptococcus]AEL11580.1 type IC specificity subunit [Streptococcus pseudopneumoniae IS7493]MBF9665037.1 restriction endonuclease subunit S [Streptococcus pseudopneumoniae]TMR82284.1 restriction endonuclease subunit S [Streptococcus pseudopneumoniae]
MTKKPSYRFTGYTEVWEEKKLGNLGSVEMCRRIFKEETSAEFEIPFFKIGTFGGEADTYITREKFEEYKTKFAYPQRGDLLLSASGSIGRVVEYDGDEAYYQDSNIVWLNHHGKINNKFLKAFYKIVSWSGIEGTTIKRLYNKNILETDISLPSLSEQTAIGSFFQDIDQLISLQQRKLEVLKEQKKTYLKLLFPAKGQTKPALRFAGFEDDWKEVKLGEVGETYTGLSGKTKEDFGHGEGKFITYVNVFNNPLTDLYGLDSIEIDDKQRRVQYGDVLFTTSSETPEDVGLSSVWMGTEDNVYLNSFCFGYRLQKGIFDLYYLAFVLRSFSVRREFMLLAQGISRFNISKTKVMDMFIHIPSLPEQEAIGSFFQDLDKAIAKQEEKVNQLKESKQTLLRKMFI